MTKLPTLVLLLALAAQASACGTVYTRRGLMEENPGIKKPDAPHWDHSQAGYDWEGTCASGLSQSPVNLPPDGTAPLPEGLRAKLGFGNVTGARVINTGHAVQVEWDAETGLTAALPVLGDSVYNLYKTPAAGAGGEETPDPASATWYPLKPLQFHMHSTCEHLLAGADCAVELHLVAMLSATGLPPLAEGKESGTACLAVFGVRYVVSLEGDAGPEDPLFKTIIANLPKEVGAEYAKRLPGGGELSLDALLPPGAAEGSAQYIRYSGSLTTPPCSEGVSWFVFTEPKATLTPRQLDDLQLALSTLPDNGNRLNNRHVLPANNRTFYATA